eukprot:s747_g23.t1
MDATLWFTTTYDVIYQLQLFFRYTDVQPTVLHVPIWSFQRLDDDELYGISYDVDDGIYTATSPRQRLYEHLNGYAEHALRQLSRHLHPNMLSRVRVHDLLQAISHQMMDQWQVVVPVSDIQLHYENARANDVILDIHSSILSILDDNRPEWTRRQYDGFSSVDHPNQWVPFICRLTCRLRPT